MNFLKNLEVYFIWSCNTYLNTILKACNFRGLRRHPRASDDRLLILTVAIANYDIPCVKTEQNTRGKSFGNYDSTILRATRAAQCQRGPRDPRR